MSMTNSNHLETRSVAPAIFTTSCAALLAASLSTAIAFILFPPSGWHLDSTFTASLSWLITLVEMSLQHSIQTHGYILSIAHPSLILGDLNTHLKTFDLHEQVAWRFGAVGVGALLASAIVGVSTYFRTEKTDRLTHIRGRQLFKGRFAKKRFLKQEKASLKSTGKGLEVSPGLKISRDTESKHTLVIGASGGGKTQIMLSWLSQVLNSNDQVLIHDTKGDMTATLPANAVLLAPHDKRSWAWDVAKDCVGIAAAQELAANIIPQSSTPMWSDGSREILTGILRYLQKKKGTEWGWEDVTVLAFSEPIDLHALINRVYPQGANYIEFEGESGVPNKTSYGFLVGLWTALGTTVAPLAKAWGQTPADRRISLTKWLQKPSKGQRVIILQRSSEFPELSEKWIAAALQVMANYAASPSMKDQRSRRVWFFLDEFPQLQKLKGFAQFLELGRSKGMRCVLGAQDLEQISELYGDKVLKSWMNNIGTKVICKMNSGPSANSVSENMIGKREISSVEVTTGTGAPGQSTSAQHKQQEVPVVRPENLERDLGPLTVDGQTVIRALILAHGDAYRLDWPLTIWPQRRAATKPAAWTVD